MNDPIVMLCPGQGAQHVGMGRAWNEQVPAAAEVFDRAEAILGDTLGSPLRSVCFDGPAEALNRTNISQPAIFVCSMACFAGLEATTGTITMHATAGLSLGEYTALCLAGVLSFEDALRLVTERGRLMQEAADASQGGMVALIGADEDQAEAVCARARQGEVLVCANFNAPGQIVLSGHDTACARAIAIAAEDGLRAAPLSVAGAFHSPLMQPAADGLTSALADTPVHTARYEVWSNVTGQPHNLEDAELLKQRLVEQLVRPVRWSESCLELAKRHMIGYHELAPGSVLRGLMRRIDRTVKVMSHEEP